MKCTIKEQETYQVEKMGCKGCYYDNIKEGDYIRTNDGIIGKLKRIELDKIDTSLKWYVFNKKESGVNIVKEAYINKPYIEKWNKNPIDLIEIGDIVEFTINNIKKIGIVKIYEDINKKNYIGIEGWTLEQIKIIRILTHEQYQENCFKVVQE